MILKGTGHRHGAEFIADMVVIGISAESEIVPDSVMGELHLGAPCKIACQ